MGIPIVSSQSKVLICHICCLCPSGTRCLPLPGPAAVISVGRVTVYFLAKVVSPLQYASTFKQGSELLSANTYFNVFLRRHLVSIVLLTCTSWLRIKFCLECVWRCTALFNCHSCLQHLSQHIWYLACVHPLWIDLHDSWSGKPVLLSCEKEHTVPVKFKALNVGKWWKKQQHDPYQILKLSKYVVQ